MKKIILFLAITAILLLAACKTKETVQAPPEVPSVPTAPAATQPEQGKLVSDLRCVDGKIEGVILNTGDAEATLAKDIKVLINGLLVVDPLCDKMTLAAGESTFCEDLSGHFAIRTGKVNTIQVNALRDRTVESVDCAAE